MSHSAWFAAVDKWKEQGIQPGSYTAFCEGYKSAANELQDYQIMIDMLSIYVPLPFSVENADMVHVLKNVLEHYEIVKQQNRDMLATILWTEGR